MAEKEKKEEKSFFKSFAEAEFLTRAVSGIKKGIYMMLDKAQQSVEDTVEFVIKKAFSLVLIITAVIFILVGLGNLIDGYFMFPSGSGYVIIGLIVFLIGIIINALAKK